MSLATFEATFKSDIQILEAEFVTFLSKVKSGAQIVLADVDAAIQGIAKNIAAIDNGLKQIEAWLPEILAVANVSPAHAASVSSALADAQKVVSGLDAVAATVNSGGSDVTAVVNGIVAVKHAQASTASLVAHVASLPSVAQAEIVSPPTPPTA